jgi:hypothetical protein
MMQKPWLARPFEYKCDHKDCDYAAALYIMHKGRFCAVHGPGIDRTLYMAIKTLRDSGLIGD